MRIAVLSCNFHETLNWLMTTNDKSQVKLSRSLVISEKGDEYFIISTIEQAHEMEFNKYIKAPDYYTLEDVVKTRVR